MALKKRMTKKEIIQFLDNELVPQTKLEIQNWLKPRKKQGGYFVVVRQIFCMIDFLGAVFIGYPINERRTDIEGRRISTSYKSIKFITTFFEPHDKYEETVVKKLHSMYRNGLIHLYQPKILKLNSNSKLLWFFYKGRAYQKKMVLDSPIGKLIFNDVSHLSELKSPLQKNVYYLTVCIDSLYDDFEKAVIMYRNKLEKIKYLQRNWRTAVNAICKPR